MTKFLFGNMVISRGIYKDIFHNYAVWHYKRKSYMAAISYSQIKGDWWKDAKEETAKFFSVNWFKKSNEYVRTGVFVGRLAVVIQSRERGNDE